MKIILIIITKKCKLLQKIFACFHFVHRFCQSNKKFIVPKSHFLRMGGDVRPVYDFIDSKQM